ncbi:AIPR family protein [Nocardiopsis sp. SBT366]|uniref:AIPR family protein n=1 Tax=Nocardiopsis sp. SBT366 TaxID=1580529 RepID=UPI0018F8842C|nr:AIPR family protein [Nocardiopsis sp. SBT366]
MLFALQLKFGIEDIDSVASVALTDGPNDKKCDLVYINRDNGIAIVAQGYLSPNEQRRAARANKASDLNTAVSWLISGDVTTLPEVLRSAALELRDALEKNQINDFYIWYCHNLSESDPVQRELETARGTAASLIRTHYSSTQNPSVTWEEIGKDTLESLYTRTQAPIIVPEEYNLAIPGGFETSGDRWKAYCTSVNGKWLYDIWQKHKSDLMSPNVRGYLGIVRSERNINNGIKTTAREAPENFWIYNNGLTMLVNSYHVTRIGASKNLKISGVGIVNGAQTTGSLGNLTEAEAKEIEQLQVMVRFVECSDPEVLGQIVKFNNTQNKVEASDFRSKDPVQERLRTEFENIPDSDYRGGRRGGIRDAIERSKNLLADNTVAQSLAAFHGQPNIAYNETRRIWDDDAVYASVFSEKTSARHVVLTYSLQRAIEEIKRDLQRTEESERTQAANSHISFLRKRGSTSLFVTAISESLEILTGKVIPSKWSLAFSDKCSPREGIEKWKPAARALMPFVRQLDSAVDNNLKSQEKVREAIKNFQAMVESSVEIDPSGYKRFSDMLEVA